MCLPDGAEGQEEEDPLQGDPQGQLEKGRHLRRMSLGPHVLRSETAAVAVAALLGAMRTGTVASVATSRPG